jgi:hypothetical protein
MKVFFVVLFVSISALSTAQMALNIVDYNAINQPAYNYTTSNISTAESRKKLYQRNVGVILGLQKGKNTAIELGGEAHWRKMSLAHPSIIGATANMEYNLGSNILGYKAGIWRKKGRINFTYGANVSYYTNFDGGSRWGVGPSVGFRILGLHLVNGVTLLTKDNGTPEKPVNVNPLYLSIRYYVPVENKFTWDRKTMKKKRERRREREDKKREREERREDRNKEDEAGEKKGLQKLFNLRLHKEKKEPIVEEKKGLRKLFNFKKKENE